VHALRGNVMDRSSCRGHCCRFDDPGLDSEEKALKSMANLAAELLARKDTSVIFGPVKKNAIKQVHYIAQMPAVKVRHAMRCCASMCGSMPSQTVPKSHLGMDGRRVTGRTVLFDGRDRIHKQNKVSVLRHASWAGDVRSPLQRSAAPLQHSTACCNMAGPVRPTIAAVTIARDCIRSAFTVG
jgi:hypothetical protein